LLSKASLSSRTSESIHLEGIFEWVFKNLIKHTIPLEPTERQGVITKRAFWKTLTIEMLRGSTTKHYARFDTLERFELLKSYFGSSILGAARFRRFAGPSFSPQTGPNPAFSEKPHYLQNEDSVGVFLQLPETPTTRYYSKNPGIDVLYIPAKRQFTVRIQFVIADANDPDVLQQLLNIPPQPMANNDDNGHLPDLVSNVTEFEHEGTMFVVRAMLVDNTVLCEKVDTAEAIIIPLQEAQELVNKYNRMDESDEQNDEHSDESMSDED
jgi:hypothetical protein